MEYLRHFSAVSYAAPLSLTSISLEAWGKLDDASRAAFEEAARETSERQWAALDSRVAANFARMRENGVTIDEKPPADVMEALHEAADATVAEWLGRAGPTAQKILQSYRERQGR